MKKSYIFYMYLVMGIPLLGKSRSFFMPRSTTHDPVFENALTLYDFYHPKDQESWVHVFASPFHQRSTNQCRLGGYFLPEHNCTVSVKEDGTGDIGSLWLGIISKIDTSFSSEICLAPERRVSGAYFNALLDLCKYSRTFWLGFSLAVMRAEHCVGLNESDIQNPGTLSGFANVTEALSNDSLTAGKFSECTLCETGVDDIQVKLGWNKFFCENESHVGLYLVGSIPTGDEQCSEFVFEPIVGTKHGALGLGIQADVLIMNDETHHLAWLFDSKFRYQFKHEQRRSFDLCKNGDWSRYLLIVLEDARCMTQPAINCLTNCVGVEPRISFDIWTAVHYAHCNWDFEAGYNFFFRQAEKISCKTICDGNFGIFDLGNFCSGNRTSSSCATISESVVEPNKAPSDSEFISLTADDINLRSAAHPRVITNKLYGSLAYNYDWPCQSLLLGLGGSFEFADKRALEQWAVWGTVGIGF